VISGSDAEGLVRQNWPLLVAIGLLLGGAMFGYMRSNDRDKTADAAGLLSQQQAAIVNGGGTALQRPQRKTPQELAKEQIAEHEATIEADPDHKDTPAYLMAIGNLYKQKLLDYEQAAQCYERILMEFPDWDNVRVVYMQLATCYERLEDKEKVKGVYEQMLDVFPSDSQEYAIARDAVYR
jgi:tetratricopeptide (TPR) repeat protein